MLPNFLIAGTFPAGTGHLFSLLIQHPDVYLPLPMAPECNFFFKTRDYEKGIGCYEERWFSAHEGQAAVGERSSLLLCGPWAAERVKKHLPEVKLIFLFRNPTDRAYANYRFTALAGFEDLGFEEALEAEQDRIARTTDPFWTEIQPHAYFSRGVYHEQLRVYREHFDESQLLLMRSDELLRDLGASMAKILGFLGVDATFQVEDRSDFTTPGVIDLALQCELRKRAGASFDQTIQRLRDGSPAESDLDHELRANLQDGYEPLSPELRRALNRRYAPHNRELEAMVSFSVDDWF